MRRLIAVLGLLISGVLGACGEDEPGNAQKPSEIEACGADADCRSGVCEPLQGCVDCRSSSQCQANERCWGGSCIEVETCEGDRDCEQGVCDTGSRTCVSCKINADCEAGRTCVAGACQKQLPCQTASGCPASAVCDLAGGRCVECLGKGDCSTGERCVEQECVRGCLQTADCEPGLGCDVVLGLCLECAASADCPTSQHCSKGSCVLDVCTAGSGTCVAGGHAVQLCSQNGDGTVPLYCSVHATCSGSPGDGMCSDWVCKPGITGCNENGKHLEKCSADGLIIESSTDCSETHQACVVDRCVDIICEPSSVTCDEAANALHVCSDNGTVDTVTQCGSSNFCDAEAKACQGHICAPGSVTCVDGQVATCNELGSEYASIEPCGKNQKCVAGTCADVVCDPSDQFCGDDGNAYTCDATGTVATLRDTCELPHESGAAGATGEDYGRHCEDRGSTAACYVDPCVKGQLYCRENRVSTCNAQGTGPVDAGVDCGDEGVCVLAGGAHCAAKVCTPSSRYCNANGDVYYCNADGTSSSLWDDCGASEYCDSVNAYCYAQQCTPNAAGCNGGLATTCKADGSDWVAGGTDCSAMSKVCDAGQCKAKVCNANEVLCSAGDVHRCNALGTGSTVYNDCAPNQYCSAGSSYCYTDICTAGQPYCASSTNLSTCAADGSGAKDAGKACGANKLCDQDACKDLVCTPYATFCRGGHVQTCSGNGTAFTQTNYCFADEYCSTDSSTSASCRKRICAAGDQGCTGETFGSCNADGSAFTSSPTECKATGKVCTWTGCAASAVDKLGAPDLTTSVGAGSLFGDVFYAVTPRRLTAVELGIAQSMTGISIHWVIWVSSAQNGPYTPVFDAITTGTVAGYQSPGPLSLQLSAHKYYFVSAHVTQQTTLAYSTLNRFQLSFCNRLGGVNMKMGAMLPTTLNFGEFTIGGGGNTRDFDIRITTELP